MDYKEFLIESGKRMLHSGLTVETWGNISVRDPETGLVYITPSAMSYDSLLTSDIVVMDIMGNIVEGNRKPSIEKDMHLKIMRERPEINAVIHTHPIYSLAFAVNHETIPAIIDEAAQVLGGPVFTAKYALPGTIELADNVIDALGKAGMACLLANHGAVCVGKDMNAAFKVCTVLEMTAQVYQNAKMLGQPVPISKENIDFMKDYAANSYKQ